MRTRRTASSSGIVEPTAIERRGASTASVSVRVGTGTWLSTTCITTRARASWRAPDGSSGILCLRQSSAQEARASRLMRAHEATPGRSGS